MLLPSGTLQFILDNTGVIYSVVSSYFPRKSLVMERMVSYNFYYLFPTGIVCVKVSLQTSTLLSSCLLVTEPKFIEDSFWYT